MKTREAIFCVLIRTTWDSLDSQLDGTHGKQKHCQSCGGNKFHRECVREYAEMILKLSKLL